MSFFRKRSLPMLLVGLGILSFVLGLAAVFGLTGRTETELLDGFIQQVSSASFRVETVYGSPGHQVNVQYDYLKSIGGAYSAEDLVLTLVNKADQSVVLRVEGIESKAWDAENLTADNREMVIPLVFTLPEDIAIDQNYKLQLKGVISYPVLRDNSPQEYSSHIDLYFLLEAIDSAEMLSLVRQRPIRVAAVSLPLAVILILIGARTELSGRKTRQQT